MFEPDHNDLHIGGEARTALTACSDGSIMLAEGEERARLDLAPIGYPRTTPLQHPARDGQLATIVPALAKADARSQLPPHTARHRAIDYTPYHQRQRHPSQPPYRRTDINHELLHPSRLLDARANWCVYKSIRQLPLDCHLRQPASDRGECCAVNSSTKSSSRRSNYALAH